MAQNPSNRPDQQEFGNIPVIVSAVLALFTGTATAVISSGGTSSSFRWELGAAAACIAFLVSLLTFLLLIAAGRPNPEDLGQGSGINRSFGALPPPDTGRPGPSSAPRSPGTEADGSGEDADG